MLAMALLLLLAFLAEDLLLGVFHALALVRLGTAKATDLGGNLSDLLLVGPAHHDLGRLRRHNRNPLRDRILDVVTVAERELQIFPLHRSAIADAVDLEPPLEALG